MTLTEIMPNGKQERFLLTHQKQSVRTTSQPVGQGQRKFLQRKYENTQNHTTFWCFWFSLVLNRVNKKIYHIISQNCKPATKKTQTEPVVTKLNPQALQQTKKQHLGARSRSTQKLIFFKMWAHKNILNWVSFRNLWIFSVINLRNIIGEDLVGIFYPRFCLSGA